MNSKKLTCLSKPNTFLKSDLICVGWHYKRWTGGFMPHLSELPHQTEVPHFHVIRPLVTDKYSSKWDDKTSRSFFLWFSPVLSLSKSSVRIIHRFWATCRKLFDKNRLDFKASRLRIRQSNRKREIESRFHLSLWLVSKTRHVKLKLSLIHIWRCRRRG